MRKTPLERPCVTAIFTVVFFILAGSLAWGQMLSSEEQLGKSIFFDLNLSINGNQSCAACHAPGSGWTGPDPQINAQGSVYEGSIPGRFGNRKPPSAAYATQSPILAYHKQKGGAFAGGNFWDGRATGERLGSPSAEQAQGPFLNPLEQALTAPEDVVGRICTSSYASLFLEVCGSNACDMANVNASYDCVGYSIAAYEASAEVSRFSSKYDAIVNGKEKFTKTEHEGFNLFIGKAKCYKCHTLKPRGKVALFTDYTYDNLGIPRNPENPFYEELVFNPLGAAWIDPGLGGFLSGQTLYPEWVALASENYGRHKVPTLRNVDKWDPALGPKVKAYGHNGYFKSLKRIVHFYNTRDLLPVCPPLVNGMPVTDAVAEQLNCWPLPEMGLNMNTTELGNLGLSDDEENALVTFMATLSDGWTPTTQ